MKLSCRFLMSPSLLSGGLVCWCLLFDTPPLAAQGLPSLKLESRSKPPLQDNSFGFAVAVSNRYVVVGEPLADGEATDAGGVQVFDAVTGRFLRQIKSIGAPNGRFGWSVALCGDFAVIGAPGENEGLGEAHLVDLRNGKRLRSFQGSDSVNGDNFGEQVAMDDRRVLVSASLHNVGRGAVYVFDRYIGENQLFKLTPQVSNPGDYFGNSMALSGRLLLVGALNHSNQKGAAYVFDLERPPPFLIELFKLTAPDGMDGDEFGASVALDGLSAIVGAWGHNGGRGAAYAYDLSNNPIPAMIRKLTATGASVNDSFGSSVALDGHLAAVGAYGEGNERGAAYVFNLINGDTLARVQAADGKAQDFFGFSVDLHGNALAVGAYQAGVFPDGRQGVTHLFPNLARPLPGISLVQRGAGAPGLSGGRFSSFADAFVTGDGYALFSAGLSGFGASGGSNLGVFAHSPDGVLRRLLQRGVTLGVDAGGSTPNARISRVEQLVSAHSERKWARVVMSGAGVNPSNSSAWFLAESSGNAQPYFRIGENYFKFTGGEVFAALPDLVQSTTHAALSYRLRQGAAGVDKSNDSGALGMSNGGPANDLIPREGLDLGGGELLGESFGRISAARAVPFYGFGAHVWPVGNAPPLRKLFLRFIGGSFPAQVASENQIAPNLGGFERFSGFVGETNAAGGLLIYRATLGLDLPLDVTTSNNEGLWYQNRGIVLRKGSEVVPSMGGVVFSRILGFWPCGPDRVLVHTVAKGAGVTAANDGGLWLWDYDGGAYSLQMLLREGAALPYPDSPRVGVIQRVDADATSGRYTVLTSLTGNSGQNQALWMGQAGAGNTGLLKALRLPVPRLRKGTAVQATLAGSSRITQLALPMSTDKTGAGCKGRAQIINSIGQIMIRVGFSGGATELLTGRP